MAKSMGVNQVRRSVFPLTKLKAIYGCSCTIEHIENHGLKRAWGLDYVKEHALILTKDKAKHAEQEEIGAWVDRYTNGELSTAASLGGRSELVRSCPASDSSTGPRAKSRGICVTV